MTACSTITCSRPLVRLKCLLLAALFSAASPLAFAEKTKIRLPKRLPTIRSTRVDQLNLLKRTKIATATVQVTVPTSFFWKDEDPLSNLMYRLPQFVPGEKLPNHRRYHSTIFHLDDLAMEELIDIIWFFENLPNGLLAEYGLDREVDFYNAAEPLKFGRLGVESVFAIARPAKSFIEWQTGWYRLVKDLSVSEYMPPRLRRTAQMIIRKHLSHFPSEELKRQALSAEMPHFSIVQLRRKEIGKTAEAPRAVLTEPVEEAAFRATERKLREILEESNRKYFAEHGKPYAKKFSLAKNPLQVVIAPRSSTEEPSEAIAFKLNEDGMLSGSSVVRYPVPVSEPHNPNEHVNAEFVELYTRKLVEQGVDAAIVNARSGIDRWAEPRKAYAPLDTETFVKALDPKLASLYLGAIQSKVISPSQFPAEKDTPQGKVFFTNQTKGTLQPGKGIEYLRLAETLDIKSSNHLSIGYELYASMADEQVLRPGDADIAVGVLLHLEKGRVFTPAQRDAEVVRALKEEIFGPLLAQAKRGEITIVEMRASSAFEMGLSNDPLKGREDAWYFAEDDLDRGYTVDPRTGRKILFDEALRHKNFLKGKIKFADGREISVQFLIASHGKTELGYDAVVSHQQDAVKGVPPVMRSAYAANEDSAALFLVLQRAFIVNAVQKGSLVPKAISDPHQAGFAEHGFAPKWNSKFAKKSLNLAILFGQGGFGLDEIYAVQAMEILKKKRPGAEALFQESGGVFEYLKELKDKVRDAFNQPALALTSEIRHRVNDFREYNERGQIMPDKMWREHVGAFERLLPRLKRVLEQLVMEDRLIANSEIEESLNLFAGVLSYLGKFSGTTLQKELIHPRYYPIFKRFESQITALDGKLVSSRLPGEDRAFIETYIRYLPYMHIEYTRTRKQLSDEDFRLELRQLGIKPTDANIALLNRVERVYDMSETELLDIESKLFGLGFRGDNPADSGTTLDRFIPDCNDIMES